MNPPVFTRTPPGLSNQAAFLSVDLVVFTEGGTQTLSVTDVENGIDNGETPDVAFWRAVIESHGPPDKRIHVKSVGSKTTVRTIADLIQSGQVIKVVAAMDRDMDNHRQTLFQHPNVLYTQGYSWENDVWTQEVSVAIFNSLSHDRAQRESARAEISSFFSELHSCFCCAVRMDRSLAAANVDLIPRDELEDIVRPSPPQKPLLLRGDLGKLIWEARKQNTGVRRHHSSSNILEDLHGHTLSKAVLALLRNTIQALTQMKISNAVLTSLALTEFLRGTPSGALPFYSTPVQAICW